MMTSFRVMACVAALLVQLPHAAFAAESEATGYEAIERYTKTLDGERREAADFLLKYLPAIDRTNLSVTLFQENLEEAFAAREKYPWTRQLPKELFFNDVLPHALADETRDPWRKELREMFDRPLSKCTNLLDAAAVVGSRIGKLTGVKYSTEREQACQSPAESMRTGKASCTGLSILMVDALRAAGIPARLAAIPLWGTLDGNHTWVEVHDGEGWQMSDYGSSPKGWNKGWAIKRCAFCDPAQPIHGVFASSYSPTGLEFPMAWSWNVRGAARFLGLENLCLQQRNEQGELVKLRWRFQPAAVPGIDRTAHYIELAGGRKQPVPKDMACVAVRAFVAGTKDRVAVAVRVTRGEKEIFSGRTSGENQDLNDYVRVVCRPGTINVEYEQADGSWTNISTEARPNRETPVKIEVPAKGAAAISPAAQRNRLATVCGEEQDLNDRDSVLCSAETPKIESQTANEAAGILTPAQRSLLATWFRGDGKAWPSDAPWPALANPEAVDNARAELWSIFRESHSENQADKELGPLPPKFSDLPKVGERGLPGISQRRLTLGQRTMPFVLIRRESSPPPAKGRALFICMHGGGKNDKAEGPHSWSINNREWQSQASLAAKVYPGEGLYFVPRMVDDRLGRWWHSFNQEAFDLVITHAIREWGVDPDRVYIMGISEGAYGTEILAPFMADRFAAACAMAGGTDVGAVVENLRNLPFRTDVGESDTMYDRNNLAHKSHARMDKARKEYGGFEHKLNVQSGKGHGIDYRPGSQWITQFTRNPRPDTVIWIARAVQKNRRPAFYWLELSGPKLPEQVRLVATLDRAANTVKITALGGKKGEGKEPLDNAGIGVLLDDTLLDLSKPVTVTCNGKVVFSGIPERSVENLARSLVLRDDPRMAFPVRIPISL